MRECRFIKWNKGKVEGKRNVELKNENLVKEVKSSLKC